MQQGGVILDERGSSGDANFIWVLDIKLSYPLITRGDEYTFC